VYRVDDINNQLLSQILYGEQVFYANPGRRDSSLHQHYSDFRVGSGNDVHICD